MTDQIPAEAVEAAEATLREWIDFGGDITARQVPEMALSIVNAVHPFLRPEPSDACRCDGAAFDPGQKHPFLAHPDCPRHAKRLEPSEDERETLADPLEYEIGGAVRGRRGVNEQRAYDMGRFRRPVPSPEQVARALAAHAMGHRDYIKGPDLAWRDWLPEARAVLALFEGGEG